MMYCTWFFLLCQFFTEQYFGSGKKRKSHGEMWKGILIQYITHAMPYSPCTFISLTELNFESDLSSKLPKTIASERPKKGREREREGENEAHTFIMPMLLYVCSFCVFYSLSLSHASLTCTQTFLHMKPRQKKYDFVFIKYM